MRREKFWVWAVRSVVQIASVVIVVAFIVVACVPVVAPPWEVEHLAQHIKIKRVIASKNGGIFGDGCAIAFLELDEDFARRLRAEGGALLNSNLIARGNKAYASLEWLPTPATTIRLGNSWSEVFAKERGFPRRLAEPTQFCDDGFSNNAIVSAGEFDAIHKAMEDGKAYYTMVNRRYGLAVVIPHLNRAAVFYWY